MELDCRNDIQHLNQLIQFVLELKDRVLSPLKGINKAQKMITITHHLR